jgi:tetratricopeptide (TPR) repeat protein/energy-coupling factor transporter ATP-binding protein EcfA2
MPDVKSYEAPAREPAALPVMLPIKLIGREAALAQVYAQLKENRPVLVHGESGVGKTALAATLASAYTQQPGGVLWFNVDNDTLESLLVRVGRAYDITDVTTTDTPTAMVGAVAAALMQHKPLVVLDGNIDAQVAAKFITRCADRLPVILIDQDELEGPWTSVELAPLETPQAALLFKQESALNTPEHDAAVVALVQQLEHLPYTIGIAARAMIASKQNPTTYGNLLRQVSTTTNGDIVQAVLAASFGALNGALQGVILILGATFRGEASAEMLSLISGAPAESVQQAMNMLVQLHLVERVMRSGAPYYRLHPITHDFAQSRLEQSNRLADLEQKVRDAAVAYTQRYGTSHDRLAAEMDNLLAAARGQRDLSTQLLNALNSAGNFANERGYVYELTRLRGTGAATPFPAYPPERTPELAPEDQIDIDALFADDEEDIEDYDDADDDLVFEDELEDDEDGETLEEDEEELDEDLYEPVSDPSAPAVPPEIIIPFDDLDGLRTALGQARQLGDRRKQVEILRAMGKLQTTQNLNNEALTTYNEALSIYENLDDRQGTLETLDMLSALMVKTDNAQAAVLNANRGIKLAEELNDNETRLQLLITLGDAREELGESEDAAKTYSQALELARNSGDGQHEAIILYKLGYAQLDSGDPDTAVDTWEQALKMFRTQNKRDYEGRVLGGLGSAYGELGRWAEAINFHTSALYIAREVKDAEEEALQLSSLGYANTQAENLGQALLRYRQALHLAFNANNRDNIVTTILDLVRLLLRSPRHISIAELLIDEAVGLEPNDKDVRTLRERVTNERTLASANGTEFMPVNGSARDYARNAYKLLDE